MYLLYPIADKSKILQQKESQIVFTSKPEPITLLNTAIKLKTHYLSYTSTLTAQKQPFEWEIDVIATKSKTGHYVPSTHTLILSLRTNDSYLNYFRDKINLIQHSEIELTETLDMYRMGWETEHVGKIWVMEKVNNDSDDEISTDSEEREENQVAYENVEAGLEIDERKALVDIINSFDQNELQEMLHKAAQGGFVDSDSENKAIQDSDRDDSASTDVDEHEIFQDAESTADIYRGLIDTSDLENNSKNG
ncbi:hypothetical protein HDV01_003061 [Terramyces sp. JEL0728]|nr:hypothetical protein HDV01_003061 [Terramyces sp. JEL0728]